MHNRRNFIRNITAAGLSIPFGVKIQGNWPTVGTQKEKNDIDWDEIRTHFLASSQKTINLNNGSSSNMPLPVLEYYQKSLVEINSFAPYKVLNSWTESIANQMERLAAIINAESGELAFVRNTTEAINIILWGLDLTAGDEVLRATWDYPLVNYSLNRLVEQKSIRINTIQERLYNLSDEEIVSLYDKNITESTKLIIVTWMTHKEGRILPIKKICELAHKRNIEVLVDGAHTIGQIDVNLKELNCDYYATSMHKWLNAPLGSGLLYIKKDLMESHHPILSYDASVEDLSLRYTYLGTHAYQNLKTLEAVLDYLDITGLPAKQARLHSLTQKWMKSLGEIDEVLLYTPIHSCCAVASMGIKGMYASQMKNILKNEYNIWVKATGYKEVPMIRISPNMYTSEEEIDYFIASVKDMIQKN